MYYTLLYYKNDRDIQAAESNMAARRHLEYWVYSRHPRCLPRFILKLRYPFTHFKRESLCQKKCMLGPGWDPVLDALAMEIQLQYAPKKLLDQPETVMGNCQEEISLV